jgi:hypothetical protein
MWEVTATVENWFQIPEAVTTMEGKCQLKETKYQKKK